jgi:signal transduction histidine kinase
MESSRPMGAPSAQRASARKLQSDTQPAVSSGMLSNFNSLNDVEDVAGLSFDELLEAYSCLRAENQRQMLALASAAHELKTPLAIMSGYLDLLLSNRIGPLSNEQARVLRAMHANSLRLHQFIQNFLAYSSFETGSLTVEAHPGDVIECLTDVYNIWLPRFQDKGVALYFPGCDKPLEFEFDYHKVQRTVSNLIENAFQSTPQGGTVWLTADLHVWERRAHPSQKFAVEQRSRSENVPNAVRISVADTGPGIAPEFHQDIFEDFVSFRASDGGEYGTGLGLAIARRLVQAQQGKIWVESELGSGSKFCFLLPLKPF